MARSALGPPRYLVRAARVGLQARRRHGPPPPRAEELTAWLWRKLGIDVRLTEGFGGSFKGFAYDTPGAGMRGRVLLSPVAPYPRHTLAHETGHLLLGNGASFELACQPWSMLPAEREANAFAACFLIALGELTERLMDGCTVEQCARAYGVPLDTIGARLELGRALGEVDLRHLERRLRNLGGED